MKKVLSAFLACTMVTGLLTTAPVMAENNSGYSAGDIALFSSFADYDGEYQYRGETKAPEGFIFTGGERKTNTGAYEFEDDTRNSKVMKLGMDAFPILPFGTNFLDGYMHLSFDYYTESKDGTDGGGQELKLVLNRNDTKEASTKGYGDLEGNIVGANGESWNQNEYDYTKLVHGDQIELFGTGSEKYEIARKLKSHQTTLIGVSDEAGTRTYTTNGKTWYKVDVYIDRETKDSNNYFVYIDGVLQDYGYVASGESFTATDKESGQDFTSSGRRAIKGLGFWCDAVRNYGDARLVDANNKNTAQTDPGYVYIDNVYVNQYNANHCTNDTLKIVADDRGEIMSRGTKFNIGFSEYLSSVPTKENIVIKKQGTNEVFTGFTVTADKAQATLTFTEELETGVYEVSVTGVKGLMSGSTVTNTVEFNAKVSATDATETAYYYVNEDFNEFETGMVMPNWYYGRMNLAAKDEYNRYYMGEVNDAYATEVKATSGIDNSTALELSADSGVNSNNLYYFFPRGIASGDFKAEFDIQHNNGGWTFGFVNYDDYNSVYNRNTFGRVKNGTGNANKAPEKEGVLTGWQAELYARERMESSILLGMARNNYTKDETADGADASDKRAFSPNLGFIGQDSTTVENKSRYSNPDNISVQLQKGSETENMTIVPSRWSKVEISANDNSKVYTVKVTPYKADGTLDTANAQITEWTDKETNRYHKGIMGIHFARVAYSAGDLTTYSAEQTGSVKIDNVKVYKEATYYLYDDFNDYTKNVVGTTNANVLPSGWSSWNDGNAWREFRYEVAAGDKTVGVTSSIGKTGNAEDKSMFMYYSTPVVYKTFDKPVPAGEPFVMEFDMYNHNDTGKNDSYSTVWMFMQMGKEDTQQLLGYNTPGGISANGKVFVAPASDKSEGPDATTNIINDATMATYKPYATAEGEEAKTVEDSYARINGNLSRFNVLFGRYLAWNDNHTFKYHSSGKWDAYRGFHSTDTNIAMQDEINKWVNYKVLCKPVSTSKTEYTITKTVDGVSTSATFTNDRNWMEHDTYALGFAIPFKNSGLNNVSDGSIGNKIDNIKVYAVDAKGEKITDVNKNYVEKIEAKTETKTQDVTAGKSIPTGTEKLEITFSAPVNEKLTATLPEVDTTLPAVKPALESTKGTFTSYFDTTGNCYTDYTSILDTISDVVSLRKFGSQLEADYTVSLSEDKKTVSLTFAEPVAENDKYTLGINKNIAFSGDGYATLGDSFVQSYTVSGEFMPEAGEEFAEINVTVFRGTADIKIDKAGELVTGEEAKASVRYSNTKSEPADAFVGYAFYDTTNEVGRLLDMNAQVITIEPKSSGETEFATFEVPEKMDLFKGFAWSYPDMKPYKAAFEMK